MRVTDAQLFNDSQQNLAAARLRVGKLRRQAMEGKRVTKPSDDPLAAAQARRERAREVRAEGHQRSVNTGLSALQLADSALSQVGDALSKLREVAMQQATGTMGPEERAAAATEVTELREAIRALANSEIGGRYVFSGYRDGAPPFDGAGAYQGDSNAKRVEVAPGLALPVGVTGDQVFSGAGGGVDTFAAIDALAVALTGNDVTGIRAALGTMDTSIQTVADSRAELGAHMGAFEVARSAAEAVQLSAIERQSTLTDVDPTEAYLGLAEAQRALEVAVQIAAQLPTPGLLGGR